MLYAMYTPELMKESIHAACLFPTRYLPPSRDDASEININGILWHCDKKHTIGISESCNASCIEKFRHSSCRIGGGRITS